MSKLTWELSATSIVKQQVSVRPKNREKKSSFQGIPESWQMLQSAMLLSLLLLYTTIELIKNLLNTTYQFQLV